MRTSGLSKWQNAGCILGIGGIAAIDRDNVVTVRLADNYQLLYFMVGCEVGQMVKIRYTELPAGLHVDARWRGGHTIVYLLPGLTAQERRVALNRVRSSGRMGHGPRPSAASIAMADGVDRVRTTVANGAAAVRGHPILLLPSLLVMAGTFFALVSVASMSVHPPAGTTPLQQTLSRPALQYGVRAPAGKPSHRGMADRETAPLGKHARTDTLGRRREPPGAGWQTANQVPAGNCVVYATFGVCQPG
jgi:hypothetical protein